MARGERVVARNTRARHDYEIEETYEAGIVLQGSEVKSLREKDVSLKDSYATVADDGVWLHNLHIGPYDPAGKHQQHPPERPRKLLLNHREIDRLFGLTTEKGMTLVPLRIYFRDGWAKVELAVARGRKKYDKREKKRREAAEREIEEALRRRR